jgi:hypothetical protein
MCRNIFPHAAVLFAAAAVAAGGSVLGSDYQTLALPERPSNAPSTATVLAQVWTLPLAERDAALREQILSGNVPALLRILKPVSVTNIAGGITNTATFHVTPDYLCIGSDDSYFRAPLAPVTAQRIADAVHCILPTRKMVNDIYKAAEVKLEPMPLQPGPEMTTVSVFSNHNFIVQQQRARTLYGHPLGALVAGHQKDVVITPRLATSPGKIAIYGWHRTNGVAIQPLYLGHTNTWVDYSQCIRLVSQDAIVNGMSMKLRDALADPKICGLFSDEGVITNATYEIIPTTAQTTNLASTKVRVNWSTNTVFGERDISNTLPYGVKAHLNVPINPNSLLKPLLIIYALPNGNTTEQTIGKHLKPGDDWHFDIQHIGAQTRFLRRVLTNRTVSIAYLENDLKSWPAWRKKYADKGIPEIVGIVSATNTVETVLAGHSGGGSFIFGFLNAVPSIPTNISRIAFLDANYAYDASVGHLTKLCQWLTNGFGPHLVILAYNDAVALLNGKPFVTPAGGAWGRSHAMLVDIGTAFQFATSTNGMLQTSTALEGRIEFDLMENPDRKILHTVQVEKNGFIHAMLSGTENANNGYIYFGDRAYDALISQ